MENIDNEHEISVAYFKLINRFTILSDTVVLERFGPRIVSLLKTWFNKYDQKRAATSLIFYFIVTEEEMGNVHNTKEDKILSRIVENGI
eukprot:UN14204